MTAHKHLKQLVRARMKKTGESYAAARRQVIRESPHRSVDPDTRWHFPGNVPATTALRVLLSHAGVRAPHTREPFTEAMLFGIAGGVGAGMFSFYYEAGDFASFFIAGRHLWQDELLYLQQACERFGLKPAVRESSGAKAAEKQLVETLANGPCVAWVDGYRVVTVYRVDPSQGIALIGDLADEPISVALSDFAETRGRIKKQKNRLLFLPAGAGSDPPEVSLVDLVRDGLNTCQHGLTQPGKVGKKVMSNFCLEAFRTWAVRLHGSKDKDSWERVFTPGHRLWRGLTSVYECIEHQGGGGLCRPLFVDFLTEAAEALKQPALGTLAKRYEALGRGWSELAHTALPDDVPAFREAKQLSDQKAELTHCGAGGESKDVAENCMQLAELEKTTRAHFPLTDAECTELRAGLQKRVFALYEGEMSAAAEIGEVAASL